MKASRRWTDRDAEVMIAMLLRTGVALSAAVVVLGAMVHLARHGGEPVDFRVFHGEPASSKDLGGILHCAAALEGRCVQQLGVIVLIATPVLRVAFSVVAFAVERDRMYVTFTLVVLGLLLYSLFGPYL